MHELRLQDVPEAAALWHASGRGDDADDAAADLDIARRRPGSMVLIARSGGRPAALAVVLQDARRGHVVHVATGAAADASSFDDAELCQRLCGIAARKLLSRGVRTCQMELANPVTGRLFFDTLRLELPQAA